MYIIIFMYRLDTYKLTLLQPCCLCLDQFGAVGEQHGRQHTGPWILYGRGVAHACACCMTQFTCCIMYGASCMMNNEVCLVRCA